MEFSGHYRIEAKRAAVFAALQDPDVLETCIPGCEALTRKASDRFIGKIEDLLELFTSDIELDFIYLGVKPNDSLGVRAESRGGDIGGFETSIDATLTDVEGGTQIAYKIATDLFGELGAVDHAVAEAAVKGVIAGFLDSLAARLEAAPTVAAPPLATPGGEEAAREELVDRLEHRADEYAEDLGEAAKEVEQELEVAAGRGFLGGPYVWGLLVIIAGIAFLYLRK